MKKEIHRHFISTEQLKDFPELVKKEAKDGFVLVGLPGDKYCNHCKMFEVNFEKYENTI